MILVFLVQLESKAGWVLLAPLELGVSQALLGILALLAFLELLEHLDFQDHLDHLEILEQLEALAWLGR